MVCATASAGQNAFVHANKMQSHALSASALEMEQTALLKTEPLEEQGKPKSYCFM